MCVSVGSEQGILSIPMTFACHLSPPLQSRCTHMSCINSILLMWWFYYSGGCHCVSAIVSVESESVSLSDDGSS